jgi:hypothetical protein
MLNTRAFASERQILVQSSKFKIRHQTILKGIFRKPVYLFRIVIKMQVSGLRVKD